MNPYSSKDHSTFLLCLVSRKYKYKKKISRFSSKIKLFSSFSNAPFGAILGLPAAHYEGTDIPTLVFIVPWGSASPPQHDKNGFVQHISSPRRMRLVDLLQVLLAR
jgi:hypothetical protein